MAKNSKPFLSRGGGYATVSMEVAPKGFQVWVQNHKTRRWSEEAEIIAVLGKRTFHLSNGTKELNRKKRFLRKMLEAKVETAPMSMEGATTQGPQAQSEEQ